MRPLIGLPTRSLGEGDILRYGGLATYTRAVDLAGGSPVLIPLGLSDAALAEIYARLDGLLFQGGVDVHPKEYGEPVEPFCGEIDPARDEIELKLLRWALDTKKPTLGICRGIQMLNVAAGGSLYQDIPAQLENKLTHQHIKGSPYNFLAHAVEIDPQSHLARALGATKLDVNSLHHQSIKQVAPGFHVTARAPDGIIEGIEANDGHFAVGVQFHPEWLVDDDARMIEIFRALVQATQDKSRRES